MSVDHSSPTIFSSASPIPMGEPLPPPPLPPPAPAGGLSDRDAARAAGRARSAGRNATAGVTSRPGGEADLVDGTGMYRLVPIHDLHEDPDNPRRTFRNIEQLAQSLKVDGMLQPVIARVASDKTLIVMYGHRRRRAALKAQWTHVPTIIRYGVKDSTVLAKQLQENSHRDDLDPIEEARGVRAYMRMNNIATMQQAADALGHSLTWVSNRLSLLDLDQMDQDAVSAKDLSLLKAVAKARKQSGKVRASPKRMQEPPHFGEDHFLAVRAKSRCRVAHGQRLPGGVACGICWEAIIRIDALTDARSQR